jgi:hypothetical protein
MKTLSTDKNCKDKNDKSIKLAKSTVKRLTVKSGVTAGLKYPPSHNWNC